MDATRRTHFILDSQYKKYYMHKVARDRKKITEKEQ